MSTPPEPAPTKASRPSLFDASPGVEAAPKISVLSAMDTSAQASRPQRKGAAKPVLWGLLLLAGGTLAVIAAVQIGRWKATDTSASNTDATRTLAPAPAVHSAPLKAGLPASAPEATPEGARIEANAERTPSDEEIAGALPVAPASASAAAATTASATAPLANTQATPREAATPSATQGAAVGNASSTNAANGSQAPEPARPRSSLMQALTTDNASGPAATSTAPAKAAAGTATARDAQASAKTRSASKTPMDTDVLLLEALVSYSQRKQEQVAPSPAKPKAQKAPIPIPKAEEQNPEQTAP